MDGWIKSGRDKKISARGPQIGPNVHHTDEKSKDQKETNRQIDRIRQMKHNVTLIPDVTLISLKTAKRPQP
jgi:hypothetical protein